MLNKLALEPAANMGAYLEAYGRNFPRTVLVDKVYLIHRRELGDMAQVGFYYLGSQACIIYVRYDEPISDPTTMFGGENERFSYLYMDAVTGTIDYAGLDNLKEYPLTELTSVVPQYFNAVMEVIFKSGIHHSQYSFTTPSTVVNQTTGIEERVYVREHFKFLEEFQEVYSSSLSVEDTIAYINPDTSNHFVFITARLAPSDYAYSKTLTLDAATTRLKYGLLSDVVPPAPPEGEDQLTYTTVFESVGYLACYFANAINVFGGQYFTGFYFYKYCSDNFIGQVLPIFSMYENEKMSSHLYLVTESTETRLESRESLNETTVSTIENVPFQTTTYGAGGTATINVLPPPADGSVSGDVHTDNLTGMFSSDESNHYYIVRYTNAIAGRWRSEPINPDALYPIPPQGYSGHNICLQSATSLIVQKVLKSDLSIVETYNLTPSSINMQDVSEFWQTSQLINSANVPRSEYDAWVPPERLAIQRFVPTLMKTGGYVLIDAAGVEYPIMFVQVLTQKEWDLKSWNSSDLGAPLGARWNCNVTTAILWLTKTPYAKFQNWSGVDANGLRVTTFDAPWLDPATPSLYDIYRKESYSNLACNYLVGAGLLAAFGDKNSIHVQTAPYIPRSANNHIWYDYYNSVGPQDAKDAFAAHETCFLKNYTIRLVDSEPTVSQDAFYSEAVVKFDSDTCNAHEGAMGYFRNAKRHYFCQL